MRRLLSALMRRRKVLLCLVLLALAGWGGHHLYNRLTASPAKWAQAMADGAAAERTGYSVRAVTHYTRAIREARKFGRRDLRLAESLEKCANARYYSIYWRGIAGICVMLGRATDVCPSCPCVLFVM